MTRSPISALNISAALLVFGAAAYHFSFVAVDPDLWGHIKFGADLWRNGALPAVDPYSFTAHGQRWINHEWLTELIFFFAYHHLGDLGLLLGKLALGLATVGLLYRRCAAVCAHAPATAAVMVLAVVVMSPGYMVRPQIFSFLLCMLFFDAFDRFQNGAVRPLYRLPVLMALWVNLHGGFLMGWILLAAFVGWSTLAGLGAGRRDRLGHLWISFLLASGAVLVTPYGTELLVFLFHTVPTPRPISEWAPVVIFDGSYPHLKLLALLFVAAALFSLRRGLGWPVVLGGLTLYAALRHERHMPFFAMAAAPLVAARLSQAIDGMHQRWPRFSLTAVSRGLIAVGLLLAAANLAVLCGQRYAAANGRIIVNPVEYPTAALRFINANAMGGNIIVPFDWGEHAIWQLYPRCRVSVDGRFRTVYPEAVLRDHMVADADRQGWSRLLARYPAADILLAAQLPFFQDLARGNGPWIYVYSDPTAMVFIRDSPRNRDLLARFRAGRLVYPSAPVTVYFPG